MSGPETLLGPAEALRRPARARRVPRRPGLELAAVGVVLAFAALACNDQPSETWNGEQICTVGIPPFGAADPVQRSEISVTPNLVRSASGITIQNFTIGPVAGFSCAVERDVQLSYVDPPGGRRRLTVDPFECQAPDGRLYAFDGTGASDVEALFFTQTLDVWLEAGRALIVCTTAFRFSSPTRGDAGPPADEIPSFTPFSP